MANQGDISKSGNWFQQVLEEQRTELDILKTKYENLQKEWDNQQEHLGRLQGETYQLRNQITIQSEFCTTLGSTLGNLMWKASRSEAVIENLLVSNKLPEFFALVNATLTSFIDTYSREFPDLSTEETQFITSMCGILSNIAAVQEGRHFIVSDSQGKELIAQMIKLLPCIPSGSGDPVKRLLLMVLYNISINQNGHLMLQEEKRLIVPISQIINCNEPPVLKLLALRLMDSLTSDISTASVLMKMRQHVSRGKLELYKESADAEVRQLSGRILTNLDKAEEAFGTDLLTAKAQQQFTAFDEHMLLQQDSNYNDCKN